MQKDIDSEIYWGVFSWKMDFKKFQSKKNGPILFFFHHIKDRWYALRPFSGSVENKTIHVFAYSLLISARFVKIFESLSLKK
jgi:hypothetical protein